MAGDVARDVVLLVVVLAGGVLRFWGLGRQSLWYDEWLTTEATSGGLGDLLRHVADREGIPPPYFLVMWSWVRLFGDGEVALRSVSALAGVATIPVAYAAVRELGLDRRVARVAALLVAVNPMLVWYSQEARPYSLLALLGAASLLASARVWRRGRRADRVVWAVVAAGAVAVHYFAAFVVLAAAVLLLAVPPPPARASPTDDPPAAAPDRRRGWRARPWRQVGLALVPSGVVLLALAPVAREQHSHEANRLWISDFPLSTRLTDAARSALVGPSPPSPGLWIAVAAPVVVAGALLLVRARRGRRTAGLLAAAIGGLAVALSLVVTVGGVDVVLGRYLIASLVPLTIAIAAGLTPGGGAGPVRADDPADMPTRGSGVPPASGAGAIDGPAGPAGAVGGPVAAGAVGEPSVEVWTGMARHEPLVPEFGAGGSVARAGEGEETAGSRWRGRSGGAVAADLFGLAALVVVGVVSLVAVVAVGRDPDLQRSGWRHVAEVIETEPAGPARAAEAGGAADATGEADRVLVVNVHGGMAQPLLHYLEGSRRLDRDDSVRIAAVDVLVATASDRPCNLLVGRSCGLVFLGAPPPEPLARRIDLVERVDLDQFRIDRYRTGAPVTVTMDDLVSRVDRAGALVIVL